jgi:hypothetical protein
MSYLYEGALTTLRGLMLTNVHKTYTQTHTETYTHAQENTLMHRHKRDEQLTDREVLLDGIESGQVHPEEHPYVAKQGGVGDVEPVLEVASGNGDDQQRADDVEEHLWQCGSNRGRLFRGTLEQRKEEGGHTMHIPHTRVHWTNIQMHSYMCIEAYRDTSIPRRSP